MLFKDLKAGYYIFLFNKKTHEAFQCRVTRDVGMPHYDSNSGNTQYKVVDVEVDFNGTPRIYTFNENSETGYTSELTISTVKENITREIEAIIINYEEDLKLVDHKKQGVAKCKEILASWDSSYREKKENEERLSKLEENMNTLINSVNKLTKAIRANEED